MTTQNGGYTVSWNAPTSATYYDLQEYANGTWSTIADNTTATSKARPHSGGSYQYRVRAYNSYGTRDYTATSALVKVLPPVPASLSTNDATALDSVFTLSWGASAGASNYTLQKRKQNSDGSWGAWSTHATVAATSRAFTYRELADGNWQFQVRANVTNVGSSGWRGTATVTVEHTPAAPVLSTPASSETQSYTVSWTAIPLTVSYQLQESTLSAGTWSSWTTTSLTGTSKSYYKQPGNYRYRVRACKTFACSAYSNIGITEVGGGIDPCSPGLDSTTGEGMEAAVPDDGSTDTPGVDAATGMSTDGTGDASALAGPGC